MKRMEPQNSLQLWSSTISPWAILGIFALEDSSQSTPPSPDLILPRLWLCLYWEESRLSVDGIIVLNIPEFYLVLFVT